jgi:type VI protein secretion system component Hcp
MASESTDAYMRFEDAGGKAIDAECMDELHPGKQVPGVNYPKRESGSPMAFGWFQVKKCSFSINVSDSDASKDKDKPKTNEKPATNTTAKAPKADSKTDGPFSKGAVSVTKSLDIVSHKIWSDHCFAGTPLKKVEVEVCRTGGREGSKKIPFVRLVFEDVHVESVSMNLPDEGLPDESLTFTYLRVSMDSIWTDNETGERKPSAPRHFGWDFENNKEWSG